MRIKQHCFALRSSFSAGYLPNASLSLLLFHPSFEQVAANLPPLSRIKTLNKKNKYSPNISLTQTIWLPNGALQTTAWLASFRLAFDCSKRPRKNDYNNNTPDERHYYFHLMRQRNQHESFV